MFLPFPSVNCVFVILSSKYILRDLIKQKKSFYKVVLIEEMRKFKFLDGFKFVNVLSILSDNQKVFWLGEN